MAITNCAATAATRKNRAHLRGAAPSASGLSAIAVGALEAKALLVELSGLPPQPDMPIDDATWALRERLQDFLTKRQMPHDVELGFVAALAEFVTRNARGEHVDAQRFDPLPALVGEEEATAINGRRLEPPESSGTASDELAGAEAFFALMRQMRNEVGMTKRSDRDTGDPDVDVDFSYSTAYELFKRSLPRSPDLTSSPYARGWVKACAAGVFLTLHDWEIDLLQADDVLQGIEATRI